MLLPLLAVGIAAAADGHADTPRATLPVDRVELGRMYHEAAAEEEGLLADDAVQTDVTGIVHRIVAASDRPERIVHVQVLDSPTINAFALPGGYVSVYKGLYDLLDRDQLAFVIGHELAHVELDHGMRGQTNAAAMEAVYKVLVAERKQELIEEVQAAEREGGAEARDEALDAANAEYKDIRELLDQQAHLSLRTLTRANELEADAYGLLTFMRAGYPADAALSGMAAISRPGEVTALWDSHPAGEERIAELQHNSDRIRQVAARFDEAVVAMQAGDHPKACERLEEVVSTFPRSRTAWTNLGMCNLAMVIDSSEVPFVDAVHTVRDSDIALKGVPRAAMVGHAQQAFEQAARLGVEDPIILAGQGVLARHVGDNDTAVELLHAASQQAGDATWVRIDLANAMAAAGDLRAANQTYESLRGDPTWRYVALANLAWVAEADGDKKGAKKLWEALLDSPQDGLARKRLTALGKKVGPPQPAKALDLTTVDVEGLRLGMLCDDLPEPPKATGGSQERCTQGDGRYTWGTMNSFSVQDGIVRQLSIGANVELPALGVRIEGDTASWVKVLGEPEGIEQRDHGEAYWSWADGKLRAAVLDDSVRRVLLSL